MITKDNFKELLLSLQFVSSDNTFTKTFPEIDCSLKVDFKNEKLIYPEEHGLTINERQTCSFKQNENFVVFECVHRLFEKGYLPKNIELEPKWKVGHGASGGRADIMVKDNSGKSLLLIECKTEGKEYEIAWKKTLQNGGQLFSYVKQAGSTQYACLYSSDFLNGKVIWHNYLITLKDNEKLLLELAEKSPLSFDKAKALDVEDIFKAWSQTYQKDFATKGIFEDDIPAYGIGKTKYSLRDLNIISSNDIQGKYHEFATILRQHNVSGRENAFDKLVNLFLCKIVDETNNPEELKFHWKGIAYDDQFSLIDRLQKLYQDGMQRFLGEDVVYISADQIDKAFDFFRNDPDATKDTIKKYFKELKFFNNNDFGFIDVHNEKLFYQNSAILLKIVQMLQDIRLKADLTTGNIEHQFLGDMFEGFLDQGIKQSEGQFFTPMPIVKFILKSLPLESMISSADEIPKVIDYACGAGHFLNEYAKEIKSVVEDKKEAKINDYYSSIYGIEKEYRLSKVAKVSAFMYGQDNINIIYADALSSGKTIEDKDVKDSSFSVLVANPPYSVKGFLDTISEEERRKYKLINTIGEKSYSNNSSIEAFFLERAKQLLKPGGVAAIIVPSSILTKGKDKSTSKATNVYVATRELLLKYFDIIAMAEFGAGTFGKTGTSTVTLFLRRRNENPAPADHYLNRVNAWFNNDTTKDGIFEDEHLIRLYCDHQEIPFENYATLLKENPSKELLEYELFKDYQREFDKWSEIRNLKSKKFFKELEKEEQKAEITRRFVEYLIANEKEKLYYFVLCSQNPQKVLIVKSPSKSTAMKNFLGYEWSTAKGNEGIKYLGGVKLAPMEGEDEDSGDLALEDEDKRVLSNIFNLNNINTPLYDPDNKSNQNKINHLISQNFVNEEFEIPNKLDDIVSHVSLIDMLDFNQVNFNKFISLTPKKSIFMESKWKLEKLGTVSSPPEYGANESAIDGNSGSDFRYIRITDIDENGQLLDDFKTAKNVEEKFILKEGDFLFARSGNTVGKTFLYRESFGKALFAGYLIRFRTQRERLLPEFLLEYTKLPIYKKWVQHNQTGSSQPNINGQLYSQMLIPLPPIDVQEKIIEKVSAVNEKINEATKKLAQLSIEVSSLFIDAYAKANINYRLSDSDTFDLTIGKRVLKNEINYDKIGLPVYSANVFEPFGYINKTLLNDFNRASVIWGIDGDWMVNYIPESKQFYPTDHCGVLRINNEKVHPKYLTWVLQKEGERVRFSRTNRASLDSIRTLTIKAPSTAVQNELVLQVEKREIMMKDAADIISKLNNEREAILISEL